jgi:hypothetical protein
MNPSLPNLFESLFDFYPREGHTPRENFLTEAFAYILKTHPSVSEAWLSKLLDKKIEAASCQVTTRQTEADQDTDTSIYPDLLLQGQFRGGEPFAVYCEHKWDSPCDHKQLRRYRKVAEKKGNHARLVFVGASHNQKSDAEQCFQDKPCSCFLWEDVFIALDALPAKTDILREFLGFMNSHGLSPGPPLTLEWMKAFLESSGFLECLKRLANRLNTDYRWEEILPRRYFAFRDVKDSWGSVKISFETKDFKPAIWLGFLYATWDIKAALVNPDKGIDLMLRIAAEPKHTKDIQPALSILEAKRKNLRKTAASVLLKGDPGNGNPYSILVVRDCLAEVISNARAEADQLVAIHTKLANWLHVLFDDGSLEKAFKKSRLDSGMK